MRTFGNGAVASIGALALAAAGCVGHVVGPADPGNVVISVAVVGTPVATVTVEVSAPDIDPSLVFNLTIDNGSASRTISIPAGAGRTLTARAFDSTGAVTHEGSIVVDVSPGPNSAVSIPMVPRPGQQPIDVRIGPVVVALSPATATLDVGQTLQLTATVTASNGDVLLVTVEWASGNPALAAVSAEGVVRGLAPGAVSVVGTYAGVAGVSLVTVR